MASKKKIVEMPAPSAPEPPAELPPPTFTLRADVRWHVLALIGVASMMRGFGLPKPDQDHLDRVVRLFEFYEESHRNV